MDRKPTEPGKTDMQKQRSSPPRRDWVPYVAPFLVFIVLTVPAVYLPGHAHLLYFFKTVSAGALLWWWREHYRPDIRPRISRAGYLASAAAGLLVLAAWILLEPIFPKLGQDGAFDPFDFGLPLFWVYIVIIMRIAGSAVVVPVMEELFWRSFLMRYLIHPEFRKVPLGAFNWFSFLSVVLLFGLEHNRWIQGMVAGFVYGSLVIHQKSLRGAIFAHAVTNLGLGFYVGLTRSWIFW
jgi:hypothetical protein